VIGWARTNHLSTELAIDAPDMTIWNGRPAEGLVHHSDQGRQHTSLAFGRWPHEVGLVASMGRWATALTTSSPRASSPPSRVS
jgi:putative transposase